MTANHVKSLADAFGEGSLILLCGSTWASALLLLIHLSARSNRCDRGEERESSSVIIVLLLDLLLLTIEGDDGLLNSTTASRAGGAGRGGEGGGVGLLALDGASGRDLQGDLVTGGVGLGSVTLLGVYGSLKSGLDGRGN